MKRKVVSTPMPERWIPEPNTGCWLWTGNMDQKGYGYRIEKGKHVFAHQEALGFPDGLVLHSCDQPLCVNPKHLRVGTPKDNMQDMLRRGRNHWSKRTVCKYGHPYGSAREKGKPNVRLCLPCAAARSRRYKERKRAKQ